MLRITTLIGDILTSDGGLLRHWESKLRSISALRAGLGKVVSDQFIPGYIVRGLQGETNLMFDIT